jgi:hypothetical protein
MRTTLNLPSGLLRKAQQAVHARTKTEAIVMGLKSLLRRGNAEALLSLERKLPLRIDLERSRQKNLGKLTALAGSGSTTLTRKELSRMR